MNDLTPIRPNRPADEEVAALFTENDEAVILDKLQKLRDANRYNEAIRTACHYGLITPRDEYLLRMTLKAHVNHILRG